MDADDDERPKRANMKWIFLKDSLPEVEEPVIVCFRDGRELDVCQGMRVQHRVPVRDDDRHWVRDEYEIQWGCGENGSEYWTQLDVIAWMPFPQPPNHLLTTNDDA